MTCRSRDACWHHDEPTGKGRHRATALARLQPKSTGAGPAALIAAKMVKLEERLRDSLPGRANRVRGKDALDVFRLLRAVQTDELVEGFARHRTEPHAERVSAASLHFLADNGRTATNLLSTLAAAEMPSDPTVAVSFAALTNDLLDALGL